MEGERSVLVSHHHHYYFAARPSRSIAIPMSWCHLGLSWARCHAEGWRIECRAPAFFKAICSRWQLVVPVGKWQGKQVVLHSVGASNMATQVEESHYDVRGDLEADKCCILLQHWWHELYMACAVYGENTIDRAHPDVDRSKIMYIGENSVRTP